MEGSVKKELGSRARMASLKARGTKVEKRLAGNRQAHRATNQANLQPTKARSNKRLKEPVATIKELGLQPHPLLALSPKTDDPATSGIQETSPLNSGDFIPQTTPALLLGDSMEREQLRHAILQLYLRGYTRDAMVKKLKVSRRYLRAHLESIRESVLTYMEDNPQVFGAPLEALYLQVLRRRERQSALWEELESEDQHMESVRPQFYRLLQEEDKAIEGLLGLDSKTVSVVIGSPMEAAQADILRTMGPDKLKELLKDLRETHSMLSEDSDNGRSQEGEAIIVEGTSSVYTG